MSIQDLVNEISKHECHERIRELFTACKNAENLANLKSISIHGCLECLEIFFDYSTESLNLFFGCIGNSEISFALIKQLIDRLPKILEYCDQSGDSALHLAIRVGDFDLVRMFVSKQPNLLKMKTKSGLGPLYLAMRLDEMEMVRFLLDRTIRRNLDRKDVHDSLRLACDRAPANSTSLCSEDMYSLIETAPEAILCEELLDAIEKEIQELAKMLLSHKPSLANARPWYKTLLSPEDDATILYFLVEKKHHEILSHLLDTCGCLTVDLSLRCRNNESVFQLAIRQGLPLDIIRKFIRIDPLIVQNSSGVLHSAIDNKNEELILLLLEEGADVFEKDAEGQIALPKCALRLPEKTSILQNLFPRTITPTTVDSFGFDCLFDLYRIAIRLDDPFLFEACSESFYGPVHNSLYWLIQTSCMAFKLNELSFGGVNGKTLCLLMHSGITKACITRELFLDIEKAFSCLAQSAYEEDENLPAYFLLLANHWHLRELDKRFLVLTQYFIPPKEHQTENSAQNIVKMMKKLEQMGRFKEVWRHISKDDSLMNGLSNDFKQALVSCGFLS